MKQFEMTDRRRRRRRSIPKVVPRAAADFVRQLKMPLLFSRHCHKRQRRNILAKDLEVNQRYFFIVNSRVSSFQEFPSMSSEINWMFQNIIKIEHAHV